MSRSTLNTIRISRDFSQIWSFLVNLQHLGQWIDEVREIRQLDDGDLGRGSVLQVVTGKGPVALTVSYWEPKKRLSLLLRSDRYVMETSLRLTPVPGGTEVEVSLMLQGRGLWRPFGSLLLLQRKRAVKAWLRNARKVLEASPAEAESRA